MSDMPNNVYKKYSIHSECSLFIILESRKECSTCKLYKCLCRHISNDDKTSNHSIDGKIWFLFYFFVHEIIDFKPTSVTNYNNFNCRSFIYSPLKQTLDLEMSMHSSDKSKTIAELTFWYWKDKEIAFMKVRVKN
jgi:hypothetical protein